MDKAELIRHEIEKRREHNLAIGNPLFAAMAEEDIELLLFINSMQEEPVSEKKCIFTKDSYTDEERKVLCEDCKEKCEYSKKVEPVSEDLEKTIDTFLATYFGSEKEKQEWPFLKKMAIYFANWQKEQMMAKAIDGIARPDDDEVWCDLKSFNFEDGDKIKVIVIKEG